MKVDIVLQCFMNSFTMERERVILCKNSKICFLVIQEIYQDIAMMVICTRRYCFQNILPCYINRPHQIQAPSEIRTCIPQSQSTILKNPYSFLHSGKSLFWNIYIHYHWVAMSQPSMLKCLIELRMIIFQDRSFFSECNPPVLRHQIVYTRAENHNGTITSDGSCQVDIHGVLQYK